MRNPEMGLEPQESIPNPDLTPQAECVIEGWKRMNSANIYEQPQGSYVCADFTEFTDKGVECIACGKCDFHAIFKHDGDQFISGSPATTNDKLESCPDYKI